MAGLTDAERQAERTLVDSWLDAPWRMNGAADWSDAVKRILRDEVIRLRADNARLRVEAAAHAVEFSGVLEDSARLRAQLAEVEAHAPPTPAEWHRVCDERDRLRADLRAAAERIAAQSELLSGRAEKAPQTRQETCDGGGEGCGP